MIKCIIIDDERNAREALLGLIKLYFSNQLDVITLCSSVQEGVKAINENTPDLVFLDIEMPVENGMELFKYFEVPRFKVIFTTAYEKYAIRAFKYSALDYLLKPINKSELSDTLKRFEIEEKVGSNLSLKLEALVNNLNPDHTHFTKVAFPTIEGYQLEKVSNIIYLEADGNYSDIYLKSEQKIKTSKTLKFITELLPEDLFFRIHKHYLINLNYLDTYTKVNGGDVVLSTGKVLPVSERRKSMLVHKLQNKA